MADDDMPEGAKQEIAEAIRIFREDHIHGRFEELKALITGKGGTADPPDPTADPSADPSKTPPPVKDNKTDPTPKKKSIWWGDQS